MRSVMKFLFGTVLTFLFLLLGASWSTAADSQTSAQAKGARPAAAATDNASHNEILKKMALKKFKNLKGIFAQEKVLKDLNVQIKTEGSFEVDRESSVFHWNVEKPKPSQVCLDKTGIVMDSAGSKKKITFAEIGESSGRQIASLLKLMSSDPKQLVEEFEVSEVVNSKGSYLLKPLKLENVFFDSAELHVAQTGLVDKIKIIEKSKDELNIQFSKLQTDQTRPIKPCEI
jgi:hypothetical protein